MRVMVGVLSLWSGSSTGYCVWTPKAIAANAASTYRVYAWDARMRVMAGLLRSWRGALAPPRLSITLADQPSENLPTRT